MASRKFRFVSPGVFLREIDNSQLPRTPDGIGPVLIGRTRKGPAMKPYKVRSMQEFERVFGLPMPGNQGDDTWREGSELLAESYLPYAAKAYLSANINSPITVIRLGGVVGDNVAADSNGEPGWKAGSAYGLFVTKHVSGAIAQAYDKLDFDLAAIFYGAPSSDFEPKIIGRHVSSSAAAPQTVQSAGNVVRSVAGVFGMQLSSAAGTRNVKFTLDNLRKDFNTNPIMTNTEISSIVSGTLSHHYWLGETFEETYKSADSLAGTASADLAAVVLRLDDLMADFKSQHHGLTAARTGWVFGNDTSPDPANFIAENQQKLFRIIALHEGLESSRSLIISVEDIKPPRVGQVNRYGTFSVVVKQIQPTKLVEIERFDGLNLDPNSENYIARRIGDTYIEWDTKEKRNKIYGTNPNVSEFVRVEMNLDVESGLFIAHEQVPFGFYGPVRPKSISVSVNENLTASIPGSQFVSNSAALNLSGALSASSTASFRFASAPIVVTGSTLDGTTGGYMFGVTPYKQTYTSGSGTPSTTINPGYVDHVRRLADFGQLPEKQDLGIASGTDSEHSFIFTLDDVVLTPKSGGTVSGITAPGDVLRAAYVSGSRAASINKENSFSAHVDRTGSLGLRTLLDIVDGFHMPLAGGSDGVDITEADPFNMRVITEESTAATNYAYASVDRAIEMIRDAELIEHNLAAMPGITNNKLTTKLVRTCEARADSLAIIDLKDVYVPPFQEKCSTFKDRVDGTTPELSAKNLVARQLDSSYGATYYPWVKIKDEHFNRDVWVPPSVVALGVMAYTEERDEVWFAPAGFNRGGLTVNNVGLPVLQASEQLLSKDRDTLYAANINPIAQFVSEGLVIFGQKTLQSTQSALDRINVRRLLIFVKKEVSRISNQLLFEQNVQATWNRFTNQVVPFLNSVKTRFGLSDFKVILDETTTTPDLIDRNVLYAKVLLKPARSIEFIAVDFVITNTGASFDD